MGLRREGPGVPEDVQGRQLRTARGTRGGPRYDLVPGMAGAQGPVQAQATVQPPRIQRPPSGKDVNRFGVFTGATSANTPAQVPGSFFDVPDGYVAVVRSIVLTVNNLLATSDIVWTLRQDSNPVEGWDGLTIFPSPVAVAQFAWTPEETVVDIVESATIDFSVDVRDGGTYTLGVTWHGWFYPADLAERYAEAWG